MQALVERILKDLPKKILDMRLVVGKIKEPKAKQMNRIRVAKCWSVIRFLVEEP